MVLGNDFHILLFLLLLFLFHWCSCFWFCHFIIILLFCFIIIIIIIIYSLNLFLFFVAMAIFKLLGSPIVYVCDICLPVYVTFNIRKFSMAFFIALPWILLSFLLIVLTYKISLLHYCNDNFFVNITVKYSKKCLIV